MNEPADITASALPEPSRIARAAAIIALGNIVGRALGLAREVVKSDLFGAVRGVDAFQVASVVPIQMYELLVGGMVTGGLVPVFSDYTEEDKRKELWQLFSTLVVLVGVALAALVVLAELATPLIAQLLGPGFDGETRQMTTGMLRIMLPAIFFLSMSGLLTGLLYALNRFSLPAFTSSVFNASIVIAALALGPRLNVTSMAAGIVAGSILQVALQLPGLRGERLRWRINWHHSGLKRLMRLYIPVAASLIISQLAIYLSLGLASLTGEGSIAWMNYATTLIQFPLGLVSTAISIAILPTLSRQALAETADPLEKARFLDTLAHGLRLVLFLIIPATVGLFVLAHPIVALLLEHGQFSPGDTQMTAMVLRFYLPGLIFAAIDLPLVYAFYARKDTLTPALVGLACIIIYLVAALAPTLFRPLHVTDLAMANSIQWISHAIIMLVLLTRRVGTLNQRVISLSIKAGSSALPMGLLALWTAERLKATTVEAGLLGKFAVVAGAGGVGLTIYLGLMALLKADELKSLRQLLQRRTS